MQSSERIYFGYLIILFAIDGFENQTMSELKASRNIWKTYHFDGSDKNARTKWSSNKILFA